MTPEVRGLFQGEDGPRPNERTWLQISATPVADAGGGFRRADGLGEADDQDHNQDHDVVIDCDHCSMRGVGCGDCVVTVLLGGPPQGVALDETEQHAIDVLADAGLVPPLRMVQSRRSGPGVDG